MAKTFGQSAAAGTFVSLLHPCDDSSSFVHQHLAYTPHAQNSSYFYRSCVILLTLSALHRQLSTTNMTEKSSPACDVAPGSKSNQDLAINNTLINRLFTRIALKTWGKLYKSNGLCSPISKKMIVETRPRVDLTEAATMKFFADNTSVPVPKVYCSFVHKVRTYILVERIEGEPIGRVLGLEHDVQ
jgi:hypothetical protein